MYLQWHGKLPSLQNTSEQQLFTINNFLPHNIAVNLTQNVIHPVTLEFPQQTDTQLWTALANIT